VSVTKSYPDEVIVAAKAAGERFAALLAEIVKRLQP
jgi:hypothetical protein